MYVCMSGGEYVLVCANWTYSSSRRITTASSVIHLSSPLSELLDREATDGGSPAAPATRYRTGAHLTYLPTSSKLSAYTYLYGGVWVSLPVLLFQLFEQLQLRIGDLLGQGIVVALCCSRMRRRRRWCGRWRGRRRRRKVAGAVLVGHFGLHDGENLVKTSE